MRLRDQPGPVKALVRPAERDIISQRKGVKDTPDLTSFCIKFHEAYTSNMEMMDAFDFLLSTLLDGKTIFLSLECLTGLPRCTPP